MWQFFAACEPVMSRRWESVGGTYWTVRAILANIWHCGLLPRQLQIRTAFCIFYRRRDREKLTGGPTRPQKFDGILWMKDQFVEQLCAKNIFQSLREPCTIWTRKYFIEREIRCCKKITMFYCHLCIDSVRLFVYTNTVSSKQTR